MAPPGIPKRAMHQDNVFFSSDWTRAMDRQFISILLELKSEGYWIVGKKNERACARAIGVFNGLCGTNFDPKFGVERARKLHKRYKVFTWVIQHPWVAYDASTHHVTAPDLVWKTLYEQQMLVAPYINEGEHFYDLLRSLFSEVDVVDQEAQAIIQISSDTEGATDHDSSVIEIPNPNGSCISSTQYSGGSSLNTDNIFYSELAWNYSDSEAEGSVKSNRESSMISANSPTGVLGRERGKGRCNSSGEGNGKGQSSCASWSPLKKQ